MNKLILKKFTELFHNQQTLAADVRKLLEHVKTEAKTLTPTRHDIVQLPATCIAEWNILMDVLKSESNKQIIVSPNIFHSIPTSSKIFFLSNLRSMILQGSVEALRTIFVEIIRQDLLGAICCAQPIVCDVSNMLRQRVWFQNYFHVNHSFVLLFVSSTRTI